MHKIDKTTCETMRKLVDEFFISDVVKPTTWEHLKPHLYQCSECREYYDRLRAAETMLSTASLTDASQDRRLLPSILRNSACPSWHVRQQMMYVAAIASVICIALSVLLLRYQQPPIKSELAVKGMGRKTQSTFPGIWAMCLRSSDISPPSSHPLHLPHARTIEEAKPACPIDSELQFVVSGHRSRAGYLYIVGITLQGKIISYFPSKEERQSLPLPAGKDDQTFGEGIQLSVNHSLGPVRIYGLFSPEPLLFNRVRAVLLNSFQAISKPPDRLLFDDAKIHQDRFWLRISAKIR